MTPTGMQPISTVVGRRRRRVVGVVAALVVVLAAVTFGVWALMRDAGSGLVSNRVAVAPFVNRTTDASLDHLGSIAADWVRRGLLQTEVLEVLETPPSFAADSARALRAFARAAGASLLVSGTYYHSRDSIYFQADIIDVTDGAFRGALDPIRGERDDPMQAIELLRQRIMSGVVQLSGGEFAPQVLGTGRPPKYEAYREVIASRAAFRRGDMQAMKEHARTAWSLDTSYVGAQMQAANAHFLLGEWREVDSILRLAEQSPGPLTAYDRGFAEWFRAQLDGDLQAAARATKRLIQVAPQPWMIRQSGTDALWLNRPRETVEILGNYDPQPLAMIGEPFYWRSLSYAHHLLGNYDEEHTVAQEGRTLFPDDGWLALAEILGLAATGATEELGGRLDEIASRTFEAVNAGWIMIYAGLELLWHTHEADAREVLNRAIEWLDANDSPPPPVMDFFAGLDLPVLLGAYQLTGRTAEAAAYVRELGLPTFSPFPVDTLGILALLAAHRGDRAVALRLLEQLGHAEDARYPTLAAQTRLRWQAFVLAALGDQAGAVEKLRELVRGYPVGWFFHNHPALAPLHGYPPFEELMRPKG